MTIHDLTDLLAPVDEAAPAGDNLEYDPDFGELERAATPRSERAIGDSTKAAEAPDWARVGTLAGALLIRSKDLRIALHLVQAWTWTQALPGWCAGLGLVRGLLERYWDEVYPRLDAEEHDDPTERVNAMMPLVDPQGALAALRSAVLVQSPRLGRFTLRDLRIASGTLHVPSAEDTPPPSLADIEACCLDCEAGSLRAAGAAIDEALAHAQAIDGLFVDKLGPAGPELEPLLAELAEVKAFVAAQLARRFPDEVANADAVATPPAQDETVSVAAAAGIHSTRDVLRAIEEICEYYRRNEPSSPVPILLRRAGGLVGLGFADLLKSLAPGGLAELQAIAGGEEGGN